MFFRQHPTPGAHVYTDASGRFGAGGVWVPSQWFQLRWPTSWTEVDIVVKELVPVVIAAALWGRHWYRLHIRFHVDNEAVMAILRKRSSKGAAVRHLLRCFYFFTAFYQFDYSAEHIPGTLNTAADALSRDNLPLFLSFLPQATHSPISQTLMDLLVTQQPDWGSQSWISQFVGSLICH